MVPDDLAPYLQDQLRAWSPASADTGMIPDEAPWFVNIPDPIVETDAQEKVIIAAGLSPYASSWACGGTLFLARVTGSDGSPSARELFDSIVLDRGVDKLPPVTAPLSEGGMTVTVPSYWDGAVRGEGGTGNLIAAKDCYGGSTNLLVQTQEYAGTVGDFVDLTLDYFTQHPAQFPDFTLESRSPSRVEGASDAEVITYPWVPPGDTEPLRQWQIYGKRDGIVGYATITTYASVSASYQDDIDLIARTLTMSER
jgi:hypothetical protein